MFADDIVLISTSFERLTTLFEYTHDFCVGAELSINESKTELLVCGRAASHY